MKAFRNLRVGTKLVAGFIMVALVALVIGLIGINKIRQIDAEDTKLYQKVTVPLGDLANIAVLFQRTRINLRDAVETRDPAERQLYIDTILKLRRQITEKGEKFEKNIISVTSNIQQITWVVVETAKGQETAGAAAQLAGQASELQTLVGQFKLAA